MAQPQQATQPANQQQPQQQEPLSSDQAEQQEQYYEDLLKTYPTCARHWKAYIEHQMRSKRYDKVTKLFQRSLEEILSVELYKCYLNFVRETKSNEPDLILKSFRFTLDKVGIDPNAISIYKEYIQFLQERPVDGHYLASQKITAMRKAYQEGVVNPMFHVDTLWKEYINFEKEINVNIAEKMVQDRSREHMNARRVAKEWEVKIRGLHRNWVASPPAFSPEETRQIEIWHRYIEWEKSNPLRTEAKHINIKRVIYAYKQWLLCFGHHPNVWYEYASYLEGQIKLLNDKDVELSKRLLKELSTLFEKSTKGFMKNNLLINFAYADFEESRSNKKKALDIYTKFIETERDDEHTDLTLVYIQLMRFTRRTEGLKAARSIFKRARDEKRCNYQIYVAAALMEYHCTKDQAIACKIFELGLKKFNTCPNFILSYIHFMNSLNEENNTRVLFERVLTTCSIQPKDTAEIWNSFLELEAGIGDLMSINKVERRRITALEKEFPTCTETSWAVDRYKFQGLYPCSLDELRSLGYDAKQASTSLATVQEFMLSLSGFSATSFNQQQQSNSIYNHGIKRSKPLTNRSNSNGQAIDFDQADGENEIPLHLLNQTNMCLPDTEQMLPFKPVMSAGFGAHTVPGGVFPPPQAVGNLLSRLPQPGSFWGPFVDIDDLLNIIRVSDFDELFNSLVGEQAKPRIKRVRTLE